MSLLKLEKSQLEMINGGFRCSNFNFLLPEGRRVKKALLLELSNKECEILISNRKDMSDMYYYGENSINLRHQWLLANYSMKDTLIDQFEDYGLLYEGLVYYNHAALMINNPENKEFYTFLCFLNIL